MLQPIPELSFPSVDNLESLFHSEAFLNHLLPDHLPRQRWFTSKSKKIGSCHLIHYFQLTHSSYLCVIAVNFNNGDQEWLHDTLSVRLGLYLQSKICCQGIINNLSKSQFKG